MEFVTVYEGPTPFAEALQAVLKEHGIVGIVQGVESLPGGVYPHATSSGAYCRVRVSAREAEEQRQTLDACLALFAPSEPPEEESASRIA